MERLHRYLVESLYTDTHLTHSLTHWSQHTVALAAQRRVVSPSQQRAHWRSPRTHPSTRATRATLLLFIKCRHDVEGAFCPWLLTRYKPPHLSLPAHVTNNTVSSTFRLQYFSKSCLSMLYSSTFEIFYNEDVDKDFRNRYNMLISKYKSIKIQR